MKLILRTLALVMLVLLALQCSRREQTLVILSTNDMHGKIQRFPHLTTAVEACRDTVDRVLLVDAGDRWTGNAYVDRVSLPGRPIVELMNGLKYDVVALGNHEFDFGQAHLGGVIDSLCDFQVVCANVASDTATFAPVAPYVILKRKGLKIGVVGAITNYEGQGTPAGNKSSFVGLRFCDPQQAAMEAADALRDRVDVLVLLSHMGHDRDYELLARESRYDVVIGGHTHEYLDTVVCGTQVGQTYKDLRNVGATTIRLKGKKVISVDYENILTNAYAPDSVCAEAVARYYADEELNRPIGELTELATQVGLANWFVELMKRPTEAEVGFYHIGGVRLDSLDRGGVSTATVYDLEPFSSHVAEMWMTTDQMRRMLIAKYNEPTREGHRIDLHSTTSYAILVNDQDQAVDVKFPTLKEGREYHVVIGDYSFKNYPGLEYREGRIREELITDLMLEDLRKGPITPDNHQHAKVER
ncbi:MAG: bifunctional metallophosphatase/5'-nucleotidase [Alistipes sp.]|nr:bifunctional metallophosphatase/5'-nucleotidase [Alistipes sp.]